MIIDCMQVGAFAENCYVVACEETRQGVVLDPGDEIAKIVRKIEEHKLTIKLILLTHGHLDHVKEVVAFQKEIDVPVLMHADDQFLLDNLPAQAAAFGMTTSGIPSVDKYIHEGEKIEFGHSVFEVVHTPGHSPGSVTFLAQGVAFVGDVLFAESIGRTDLPGGDYDTLIRTIKTRLLLLGDETQVFPGHGPTTTIGHERQFNPFLVNS
ncbi:MAG: MBL fold metallo-hydrolase [bacterium]